MTQPQPPPQSKSLAPIDELRGNISKMEPQFALALPKHIPVEKFVRVIQTAIAQTPDLVAADRTSLFGACMKAAQDGLLPDGREAAIVTFSTKVGGDKWIKKAQFMPMIAGILKKIRNSGELAMITSNVIYKHDKFRYWVDQDGEHILHEPLLFADRGEKIGVYGFARTKDGAVYIEVLSKEQVMAVKNVSKAKGGPWDGDFEDEMWRKSSLKRLSKRMPMSTDLEMTMRSDDEIFNSPAPVETEVTEAAPKEPKVKSSRLAKAMGTSAPEKTVTETSTPAQQTEQSPAVSEDEVPI